MRHKKIVASFLSAIMIPLASAAKEPTELIVEELGDRAVLYALPNCKNSGRSVDIHVASRTIFQRCTDLNGKDGVAYFSLNSRQKLGHLEIDNPDSLTKISALTFVVGSAEEPFGLVVYLEDRTHQSISFHLVSKNLQTGVVSHINRLFEKHKSATLRQIGSCLAIRYASQGAQLDFIEVYDVNSKIDPTENLPRLRAKFEVREIEQINDCRFVEGSGDQNQKVELETVANSFDQNGFVGSIYEQRTVELDHRLTTATLTPQYRTTIRRDWAYRPQYVPDEAKFADLFVSGQQVLAIGPDKTYVSWTAPFLNVQSNARGTQDAMTVLIKPVESNGIRFAHYNMACRGYRCFQKLRLKELSIVDCLITCVSKSIGKAPFDRLRFLGSDRSLGKIYLEADLYSASTTNLFLYDTQQKLIEITE
ncbi:hypothetical protein [Aquidulcibacter sp.]|uniref:hypothetical protein n=1 Tax=Aquidulcibacter sp. TaxID=2052990 RepID=UPI0028A5F1C4|nr:hypothetical protein [Aquidulcibacter sp.]